MPHKTQLLFESLRRTDSFILSADQKTSFCLAAGITFLGVYSSIFYSVITDEKTTIPTTLICSILGLILVSWTVFFNYTKNVFSPNLEPSTEKSLISFASIKNNHDSLDNFKEYYKNLNSEDSFNLSIDNDILENHWICSEICLVKMKNFNKSLFWLWTSLLLSIFGLAALVLTSEYFELVNLLNT